MSSASEGDSQLLRRITRRRCGSDQADFLMGMAEEFGAVVDSHNQCEIHSMSQSVAEFVSFGLVQYNNWRIDYLQINMKRISDSFDESNNLIVGGSVFDRSDIVWPDNGVIPSSNSDDEV
jgi:hypothetical protein